MAILPAILLGQLPLVIGNWAFIANAWPRWRLMMAQTLAVLGAAVLLAGIIAALVVLYRRCEDANA